MEQKEGNGLILMQSFQEQFKNCFAPIKINIIDYFMRPCEF